MPRWGRAAAICRSALSIVACIFLASLDWIDSFSHGKIPICISIGAFIAFIYLDCYIYLYEQEISVFYEEGGQKTGNFPAEINNSDEDQINFPPEKNNSDEKKEDG